MALAVLLTAASGSLWASDLTVAWLRDGHVETRAETTDAVTGEVPLGSIWKLFVFAYALEKGIATPDYRCAAPRRPDEEYCCDPGGSIDRDRALARSCGAFFEAHRLGIDAQAWRGFWAQRTDARSAWLSELTQLRPDTRVSIPQILHALDTVPSHARTAAGRALLPVMIDGYGQGALPHLGGLLRVKTFTWSHPQRPGASLGGGAGWLVDGTPVWFAASGASRNVLRQEAAALSNRLPAPREAALDESCVVVEFFTRYPIRRVELLPQREAAPAGPLNGRYRVIFQNGNATLFAANGEMLLDSESTRPRIIGRFSLSEYVARVVDREANAEVTQAARALAVLARTYLLENAAFESGCYRIADTTRTQRVSPNPPSESARQVALFTDGIVLKGQPVRYRLQGAESGVLAWHTAMERARAGERFDVILAAAFPRASLSTVSGELECRHIAPAEDWLARMLPRWQRALMAEPGFEPPLGTLAVCALDSGNPYSDQERIRIYLRGLNTREDRITLTHEFLHLSFRFHPRGSDEAFVERLARSLADG